MKDYTQCFVCDEPSTTAMNVPCAPGGKLMVCGECAKPENAGKVFDAYRASHNKEIRVFKAHTSQNN